MLGLFNSAAQSTTGAPIIDTLLAPVGGAGVVIGGIYLVFKEYRNAREVNVKNALARQAQAEKDLEDARAERDEDIKALRTEVERLSAAIEPLERKIQELNKTIRDTDERHTRELRERDEAHRKEIDRMHERQLSLISTGWILRTALAEAGIPVPEAISAKTPTAPPLDPGVDLSDDGASGDF